jgi:hypothetical protein
MTIVPVSFRVSVHGNRWHIRKKNIVNDNGTIDRDHDLTDEERFRKVMQAIEHGCDSPCFICTRKFCCDDVHACKRFDKWFKHFMREVDGNARRNRQR